MESWVLPSLMLTGIAWAGTVFRLLVHRRPDLVDWFVGSMGALNGLGYLFVLWATESGLNPYWARWIVPHAADYWLFPTLSLIAVIGVWLGAAAARASGARPLHDPTRLTARTSSRVARLAWALLLLAVLCYFLYARAYGGFAGLLKYSSMIRAGLFEQIGVDNPWSFLQRLGGLAFFASFLFTALLLEGVRRRANMLPRLLGLVMSVCFSLYVLYSWKARVSLVFYVAVFPLTYVYHRRPRAYRLLGGIIVVVMLVGLALYSVTFMFSPGGAPRTIAEFYARELSFPAASFLSAIQADGFRFFSDLAVAPLFLLPERIWSGVLGISTASYINTQRIYGYPKGQGGVTGGIPTDMITFSFMQGGVAGIAILSLLWGVALVWLQRLMERLPGRGLPLVLEVYAGFMVSAASVLYADPRIVIQRNIHLFIGMCALLLLVPRRYRKRAPACHATRSGEERP